MGTSDAHDLIFFTNGLLTANERIRITSTGITKLTGGLIATGSITSLGGVTSSLFGTASWAQSSSNSVNSQTASFLPVGTYNITSSWSNNTLTASNLISTNNYQISNLTASSISASGTTTLNSARIWHGGSSYYSSFENTNELNLYTAVGSGSTLYIQYRSGSTNIGANALVISRLASGTGFTISSNGTLSGTTISSSVASSSFYGNHTIPQNGYLNLPYSSSTISLTPTIVTGSTFITIGATSFLNIYNGTRWTSCSLA